MILGILIVLIVVCLGFLAWLFCIAPASPRGDFAEMKKYDYAHRGLHEKDLSVPENSMAGFKAAVEAGYGIEFDLQLTKDKKVVVHHDRSLKRVCGADVSIGDLTYKELQQYRLQNTEERVPLFSDVLALVDGRTPLIIELKPDDRNAAALARKTVVLLKKFPKLRFCVESFDPRVLIWLRRNCPEIVRGQLAENYLTARQGFKVPAAFALTNLLANFLTVPNFVAYRYADRAQLSLRLCRRLWGVQEVAWTLQTPQEILDAEHDGCIVIFEHCIPPEKRK